MGCSTRYFSYLHTFYFIQRSNENFPFLPFLPPRRFRRNSFFSGENSFSFHLRSWWSQTNETNFIIKIKINNLIFVRVFLLVWSIWITMESLGDRLWVVLLELRMNVYKDNDYFDFWKSWCLYCLRSQDNVKSITQLSAKHFIISRKNTFRLSFEIIIKYSKLNASPASLFRCQFNVLFMNFSVDDAK